MSSTISGKVIAITGGARGIGFDTAKRLIADGARVAIGDIDEVQMKTAATELDITAYARLDVTDPASFADFLDMVEAELGPIDVLVNNAGIMPTGWFHEESDKITRRQVEINVLGVMWGSKQALQRMLPRRSGHVINIASLAGEGYFPGVAAYCGTKHAVKALTETLRREYHDSGVDFSCVMPTFVNTELTAGAGKPKLLRNAEPQEIADAVARLVEKPKSQVRVTGMAGKLSQLQNILPRRVLEPIIKALGTEHILLQDIDNNARKAYSDRIETN
ncbi:short chain dehydrogenase [Rhodococcus sp. AW25M09]|uniref:SDR family oxidoreductase n=1 Tax=Rhodococcus sp. AW25M09 TaxID=1268303 RepID=UPI0002AC804C|nr:SDR family oxidoreductase [Rhodococcus sp. AW25M09]CCQ15574.1 short chain dehydrogenase [Rhodococcus sp. AW25M09]